MTEQRRPARPDPDDDFNPARPVRPPDDDPPPGDLSIDPEFIQRKRHRGDVFDPIEPDNPGSGRTD